MAPVNRACLRIIAGLVLILTAMVACHAQAGAAQARRVALVIGVGAYQEVGRLTNPPNDARLMAETLTGLGFTLVGGKAQLNVDKQGFDQAVRAFGQEIRGADVAVFYYSGHGLQVSGSNWLVPADANPTRVQDLDFMMVDANLVLRQMEGAGTRLNVMILDACRNNPFSGRAIRAAAGGLGVMSVPEGTVISYATQPGNVAADGKGSNSPYTQALAETMREPGLDVLRMFNRVGLSVKKATGGDQQPWVSASPLDGDFYFAGLAQPGPIGPGAPPTQSPVKPAEPGDFSSGENPIQLLVNDAGVALSNVRERVFNVDVTSDARLLIGCGSQGSTRLIFLQDVDFIRTQGSYKTASNDTVWLIGMWPMFGLSRILSDLHRELNGYIDFAMKIMVDYECSGHDACRRYFGVDCSGPSMTCTVLELGPKAYDSFYREKGMDGAAKEKVYLTIYDMPENLTKFVTDTRPRCRTGGPG